MEDLPYVRLTDEQRQRLSQVDNIIHWTRGNIIVMFQGKCANTAIKAAILTADGGVDPACNVHGDPRLNYVTRDYVIRYRNTVPVVAVVRKPWDRIVSFWRDKVAGRSPENFTYTYIPGAFGNMPFRTFVEAVLEAEKPTGDLAPAHGNLTAYGVSLPHQRIKFEDLIAGPGWDTFRHWTACAWDLPKELPHMNRPKQPKPDLDRLTEHRLRVAVYAHYYQDYVDNGWHA